MNKHLPENFPAYLLQHDQRLSPEQRASIEDRMGLKPTGFFETHPSNGDRIRRARQANQPGVFHLEEPASALFSNFAVPAKQVTLLHYADDLRLPLVLAKLQPVKEAPPANDNAVPPSEPIPETAPAGPTNLKLKLHKPKPPE